VGSCSKQRRTAVMFFQNRLVVRVVRGCKRNYPATVAADGIPAWRLWLVNNPHSNNLTIHFSRRRRTRAGCDIRSYQSGPRRMDTLTICCEGTSALRIQRYARSSFTGIVGSALSPARDSRSIARWRMVTASLRSFGDIAFRSISSLSLALSSRIRSRLLARSS
jgi:hypothetical protein